MTNPQFRLLNFQVKNEKGKGQRGRDNKEFIIQMFGMNESGETCSIFVKNYTPFFYVKVADHWGVREKRDFIKHLKMEIRKLALKEKYKKWSKRGQEVFPTPAKGDSEHAYILRHQDDYISYYENSILEKDSVIIERNKLYGFDNMKKHRFICLKFKNTTALNKVKNFWYIITADPTSLFGRKYKQLVFSVGNINLNIIDINVLIPNCMKQSYHHF